LRCVTLAFVFGAFLAQAAPPSDAAVQQAFGRLYNFDFAGAHAILDIQVQADPEGPLPYAVKAAAYLYSELNRLGVLEMDFFADDERVIEKRKLVPDPAARQNFLRSIETAQRIAKARLAAKPDDPEMLFVMCMTAGLTMDYGALVERRRLGTYSLAKNTHFYARKLLACDPPVYDAYMTFGTLEYVVGSLPFFIRWFVQFDQVKGSKQKALEELQLVAARGRYFGPLARVMMAVIHVRGKRPAAAEKILAVLASDFPENALFRKELARVSKMAARSGSKRTR
jgi:hypothetical protein